jgi:glycosyltransferase involved in cell wall biosynthesis
MFPESLNGITVKYFHLKKKIPLGKKRDLINNVAKGKFLINMDDDDYYPPCRVSHAVSELKRTGYPLAGSSKMFMFFCKDGSIHQLGPYRDNHGTAATLAYTKEFSNGHFYYDSSNGNYAEEGVFTEGWKYQMVQLDPMKTVLALSHSNNTIEKTMFLDERYGHVGRSVVKAPLKLEDFIDKDKHPEIYNFYERLPYEYKVNEFTKEVITKMETNASEAQEAYKKDMLRRMIVDIQAGYMWQRKLRAFELF